MQSYYKSLRFSTRQHRLCALFFIILSIIPTIVNAQPKISFPNVTEMTPNAASIVQYQDQPVSYYSGTPEISIPLYEIDVDGFKLPISLSYHASGIRVSQEASWVGLGWALNVGGSISRTVKNFDDFLNEEYDPSHPFAEKGYYYAPDIQTAYDKMGCKYPNTYKPKPVNYSSNTTTLGSFKLGHINDNEPDIFYYSLPSYSGKFIFNKNKTATLFNKSQNISFEPFYDKNNRCIFFKVKDGVGNTYLFKSVEKSRNYHQKKELNKNGSGNCTIYDNNANDFTEWVESVDPEDMVAGPANPYEYVSIWYLSEIITCNNRHIFFTYEKEDQYMPTQESCIRTIANDVEHRGITYSISKTNNTALRLTRIDCDFCHVVFNSSNRLDIKSSKSHPSQKLDCISIYNCDNRHIKDITFGYEYFNNSKIGQDYDYVFTRLKLKSVLDSNIGLPYTFSYDETNSMPAKNSKNTDYWGYYNGSNYGAKYNVGAIIDKTYYEGVNKAANPEYTSTYTLNKISYPTGGNETFEYEAHQFPNHFSYIVSGDSGTDGYPVLTDYSTHILTYNDAGIHEFEDCPSDTTISFTVKETANLYIGCTLESASGEKDPSYNYSAYFGTITRKGSSDKIYFSDEYPPQFDNSSCYYHKERTINLTAGNYEFHTGQLPKEVYAEWTFYDKAQGTKISFSSNADTQSTSGATTIAKTSTEYGGGLRIKSIKSDMKKRTFSYSTGKLLVEPILSYKTTISGIMRPVTILNSESSTPMSSFMNGNTVGYDCVTETVDDDDCPSYTKYYYKNEGEYELVDDNIHDGPICINYTDGLMEKKETYWDDALIKKNTYDYTSTYSQQTDAIYDRSETYSVGEYVHYSYIVEWPKLSKETETVYDVNSSNSNMAITKTYEYNDHDLVSQETTGDGLSVYKNIINYPVDFENQSIYKQMVDSNLVAQPVEIVHLKDNAVIGATRANYYMSNNMFLVKSHDELNISETKTLSNFRSYYNCKETFDYYDEFGKLRQYSNSQGKLFTYLWGYNYQYPIAMIENARYTDVESLLGGKSKVLTFSLKSMPDIQDIWAFLEPVSSCDLKNINILSKTYTYSPLRGMSSKMDYNGNVLFYNYDLQNRLTSIKDEKQATIQQYNYNYKK